MKKKTNFSSDDPCSQYAASVVAGEIIAGPHVRAQCARHLADLEDGHERGIYFDLAAAARVYRFFEQVLRLSDGQFEGLPFHLAGSQAFIIGSIFGWMREDGTRRFRRAYLEMGKGNGKSPLAAGIGLYGLIADREPGAQIYAAAAKMDQARILFNDAVSMVRQSQKLEDNITPSGVNPVNNLAYMKKGAFFKPLGRDTGKTGSGPCRRGIDRGPALGTKGLRALRSVLGGGRILDADGEPAEESDWRTGHRTSPPSLQATSMPQAPL